MKQPVSPVSTYQLKLLTGLDRLGWRPGGDAQQQHIPSLACQPNPFSEASFVIFWGVTWLKGLY